MWHIKLLTQKHTFLITNTNLVMSLVLILRTVTAYIFNREQQTAVQTESCPAFIQDMA